MSNYRSLPIERSLELIDAWISAPWPLTMEQGHQIALGLGWRSTELGPKQYISELSEEKTDCYFTTFEGLVDVIDFPIAVQFTRTSDAMAEHAIQAHYNEVLTLLKARYGRPRTSRGRSYITASWTLTNDIRVLLRKGAYSCSIEIDSPAYNALMNDPAGDPNPDETDL